MKWADGEGTRKQQACLAELHNTALLLLTRLSTCADTFIQKTKKVFQDTRSQRNMTALTADLAEVHTIMSKNIAEVLGQGEKLDSECRFTVVVVALGAWAVGVGAGGCGGEHLNSLQQACSCAAQAV